MNRYIADPSSVNFEQLNNTDWDVVELSLKFDIVELTDWYNQVKEKFSNSCFKICPEYEKKYFHPRGLKRWNAINPNKYFGNPPNYWMLNWPIERDDPLPFQFIADPDKFPEIYSPEFEMNNSPFLSKYLFGSYNSQIHNRLKKYLKWSRLFVLPEDAGLTLHIDQVHPIIARLHIQIQSHENCVWRFGWKAEREYVFESGKAYLVNTSVPHSVWNHGGDDWIMVYGTPLPEDVNELLNLK